MTKKQNAETQERQYVSPEQWKLQNFPSSYDREMHPSDYESPFDTLSKPRSTQELLSAITK